jgi:hypothetical protein
MRRRRNRNVTNIYTCVLCPTGATEDWTLGARIYSTIEGVVNEATRDFNKPFFK